ncbi:MAG: autotransporter domain-containing protein [Chlamydiales bacterium]
MKRRYFLSQAKTMTLLIAAGLIGSGVALHADLPIGIVGGGTMTGAAYAAFVFSNGHLFPISGLPEGAVIEAVAINDSAWALIGGQGDGNGYAVIVLPTGGLIPLSASFLGGSIADTAINQTGNGLISGSNEFGAYAALVAPDGTVTPLSLPASPDSVVCVALNHDEIGLIGGAGGGANAYAAYVASDGTVTQISDIPSDFPGNIASVAINNQGNGIVGGYHGESAPYAAFVAANGSPSLVLSPLPASAYILGVAMNNSGAGLIGGADGAGNVYAGYAASDGIVTPLFESPFSGVVNSTALNDAGMGLIGGQNGFDLYAALVQPDGNISALFSESIAGAINVVSINAAGVGLIGGIQGSAGYAALVAPNGTLTLLDVSGENMINSAALASGFATAATPRAVGPFSSTFYTQLAASYALGARFIAQNRIWKQRSAEETALVSFSQDGGNLVCNERDPSSSPSAALNNTKDPLPFRKNSIWIAPFGDYVHISAQGAAPSYKNQIGGVLLAYDHQSSNYMVGASLGYAYNAIHYAERLGHGNIREEMLCFYGAYYANHFKLNAALWGGLYQFSNTRHTLPILTSRGKTHGWILSPHLELAIPWAIDPKGTCAVEPFFSFDWVNGWQYSYTESGASGFNLQIGNLYGSLLQSEAGLRFYERIQYGWGNFCVEEKLSYVNQAPFHLDSATTAFVGSASHFSVLVGSTKLENLAAANLSLSFFPRNSAYPYGGFSGEVMANSSYQSYFVSLFCGIDF